MILQARDITVTARGRAIVDRAGLRLGPGELVGLVGPNGAGKSTLLKAALGLRPRVSGTVTLDGADFHSLARRERARKVAFLPQDRRVEWRLSVEQVVLLGRYPHRSGFGGPSAACRQAAMDALSLVDATPLLGRPFGVLSGGERTRVLLARALAVQAPLLLADEPIAALDPYHQLHVMEILRGLADAGTGVLAVIHDLSLAARFMDRIVLMDEGAVVREGDARDLLTPGLLSAVYGVEIIGGEQDGRPWMLPWSRSGPPDSGSAAITSS